MTALKLAYHRWRSNSHEFDFPATRPMLSLSAWQRHLSSLGRETSFLWRILFLSFTRWRQMKLPEILQKSRSAWKAALHPRRATEISRTLESHLLGMSAWLIRYLQPQSWFDSMTSLCVPSPWWKYSDFQFLLIRWDLSKWNVWCFGFRESVKISSNGFLKIAAATVALMFNSLIVCSKSLVLHGQKPAPHPVKQYRPPKHFPLRSCCSQQPKWHSNLCRTYSFLKPNVRTFMDFHSFFLFSSCVFTSFSCPSSSSCRQAQYYVAKTVWVHIPLGRRSGFSVHVPGSSVLSQVSSLRGTFFFKQLLHSLVDLIPYCILCTVLSVIRQIVSCFFSASPVYPFRLLSASKCSLKTTVLWLLLFQNWLRMMHFNHSILSTLESHSPRDTRGSRFNDCVPMKKSSTILCASIL